MLELDAVEILDHAAKLLGEPIDDQGLAICRAIVDAINAESKRVAQQDAYAKAMEGA